MKKKVDLPIVEPIYGTYHFQGCGSAVIYSNPSIKNWYLNEVMNLKCNRNFLFGYSTPRFSVNRSIFHDNPHLDKRQYSMKYLDGYVNTLIRKLIDNGCYVHFDVIDDYYIEGKTWYKQRHFSHDGLICGYDQEKKTYSIYAYDENWVYRKFEITQKSFNKSRRYMAKQGRYGSLYSIKPLDNIVELDPNAIISNLKEYLDSSLEKYPPTENAVAYGVVVHDYATMFIDKLYDGSIPYERTDRRAFRILWEHKRTMYDRIVETEKLLGLDTVSSTDYAVIVNDANTVRMLYASHVLKRRDSVLPVIRKKILSIKEREIEILESFINKVGGVLKNEVVELH